jgi:iron complex transport system ATP-binding protein
MLEIENLCAGYSGKEVLHHISFNAKENSLTVIAGPNGSGKSTLLKVLAGLLPAEKGSVLYQNKDFLQIKGLDKARLAAWIAQNPPAGEISVFDYVMHGRYCHSPWPKRCTKKDAAAVKEAIEFFQVEPLQYRSLQTLSGGEKQKAALAKARAQQSPILLFDEPLTGLDPSMQLFVLQHMKESAESKTVIAVLHDLQAALEIADQIVVLQKGNCVFCGSANEFIEKRIDEKVFQVRLEKVMDAKGNSHFIALQKEQTE